MVLVHYLFTSKEVMARTITAKEPITTPRLTAGVVYWIMALLAHTE